MKTITLDMEIQKLPGFSEADMLQTLRESISSVGAKALRYGDIENGYHFEVDFEPAFPYMSFQPILGCFTLIEQDYDKVKLIGIPQERMSYQ